MVAKGIVLEEDEGKDVAFWLGLILKHSKILDEEFGEDGVDMYGEIERMIEDIEGVKL